MDALVQSPRSTDGFATVNTQACDRCHRRKSKCDKALPVCGQCMKAGATCKYVDKKKEAREVVERLQRRLKQVEAVNRSLAAKLAAQSSSQSTPLNSSEGRGEGRIPETPVTDRMSELESGGESNELMEQVSFLSYRAGGERNFLGSASGVLLADLVHATVEATSDRRQIAWQKREGNASSCYRPSTASTPFMFSQSAPPIEVSTLPVERVARDLHTAYFENDHLSYPFLHRSSTLSALDQAYADPNFLQRNPFACFVFDMILAIATASVHKFNLETLPDAEGYQMRATQRLHEVLQGGGIQSLQAILLLCQYRMTSSIQDNSPSLWHVVGIAVRMCFEKGLHREQVYRQFRVSNPEESCPSTEVISSEIWRRCFWCVVAMDRILSITLGRPLAIRIEDTDTALPDPALDHIINRHESDDQSKRDFCRTDLFNHIIRYRIICGNILCSLHNGTAAKTDELSALAIRDKLVAELAEWHQNTRSLTLLDVDLAGAFPGEMSSFRAREWFEMLYHNARLMVFRPSPTMSSVYPADPVVLQSIFMAAKQSITLYAHLHRSRRINYTWITLHSVFMAGLSYVYAVGRHFRSCKRISSMGSASEPLLETNPTILEIVNDSRACSNVLVAISDRWNSSKHCHDVFDRLSNAVLSDAVEYYTKQGNPQQFQAQQKGAYGSSSQEQFLNSGTTPRRENWSLPQLDTAPLAVDSALHECFEELQNFQAYSLDDPIGQLSHDWLGELGGGGMSMKPSSIWET